MKTFFTTLFALAAFFTVANAETKEKTFEVKNFEQITIFGSPKVIYSQGDTYSVRVKAAEEDIDYAIAESDGKNLNISLKSGNNNINISFGFFNFLRGIKNGSYHSEVIFYVTSPDLTAVTLMGSGDFVCDKKLDTDRLTLSLKGSGDIDFKEIICDKFEAVLMGSGNIDVDKVETLTSNLQLKGSGDIEISQYKVRQTELCVIGSGDITIQCTDCDVVNASVTGSGDISISGKVKKLNKSIRGSGDIH